MWAGFLFWKKRESGAGSESKSTINNQLQLEERLSGHEQIQDIHLEAKSFSCIMGIREL